MRKESKFKIRDFPKLLWGAAKIWNANNPWRLGAVVAYYAVLSLPGLLVIIINSVGAFWGTEIVEGEITEQISEAIGIPAAESVVAIFENSQNDDRTVFCYHHWYRRFNFWCNGSFLPTPDLHE